MLAQCLLYFSRGGEEDSGGSRDDWNLGLARSDVPHHLHRPAAVQQVSSRGRGGTAAQ